VQAVAPGELRRWNRSRLPVRVVEKGGGQEGIGSASACSPRATIRARKPGATRPTARSSIVGMGCQASRLAMTRWSVSAGQSAASAGAAFAGGPWGTAAIGPAHARQTHPIAETTRQRDLRMMKLPWRAGATVICTAASAGLASSPHQLKHLNPAVVPVGDEDLVLVVDAHLGGD
jgi:hypothetical protein